MGKRYVTLLIVVSIVILGSILFNRKQYQAPLSYLSGDEPHYIMMTDSLSKDRDFNLKNDYELGRSTNYYPVPELFPHISPVIDQAGPKWYSIHTIGLPLILYLPYHFFGVIGARIWIMLLQSSVIVLFYLILKKYVPAPRQRVVGLGLLLVCPLFWQNIGGIYPDLLLVCAWGLGILAFGSKKLIPNITLAGTVVIAALLHSKGLVLIGPLLLFQTIWLTREEHLQSLVKQYWVVLVILIGSGLYYAYFLHRNYGILNPAQLYGNNGQLFSANPLYNAIAVLTDRSKGLLVHFPLLLISGPFLLRAMADIRKSMSKPTKKKPRTSDYYLLWGAIVGLTCLLITVLGFNDWSGSTAPNGRSMLPFVMALIFSVARYINLGSRIELLTLTAVGLLSARLSWLSIYDFKYYMSTGVNSFWVDRFPALTHLPLYTLDVSHTGRRVLLYGAKVLILVACLNAFLLLIYTYRLVLRKRA